MELNARASRLGKKTIECRGVTKGFGGRTVVRDFDCMLLRDDRIGIVGANGSGKSTLLNLLAGELAPDAGAVETGRPSASATSARKCPIWTGIPG
ncbi:MAG: ATP-binding cassette domain-containing protein [Flavonifractor plautii]